MKTYFSLRSHIAGALGLSLLVPAFALAQIDSSVINNTAAAVNAAGSASAQANTPVRTSAQVQVSASTTVSTAVMTRAKTKADTEIDRRIKALGDLNTRVQAMTKITADFKTNLNTNIQNQISGLTALKAKIDADTEGSVLKTDVQSVTSSYRIFALVMPQARIAAAADREATIINMMAALGAKLQARVQATQAAGADITAVNTALVDMGNKLQSAQTHAQAAVSGSATLTPDKGEKTLMAANDAALKTARAEIKSAQTDLVAARKDVDTILKGLRTISAAAAASSTVQTQ
ncbi:MAG TPA: hypothetical protein VHD31_01565 [Candidatus Paceibacterota bacterium]|nr:hypothetical protein [Candidatus Paceibacterota bacterium]